MKSENNAEMKIENGKSARFSIVGVVVKTRIRNKILALVIAICLFSILSMSVTTLITQRNLANYSKEVNLALGLDVMEGAGDALIEQAHDFLRVIAGEQSGNCDNVLNAIKFNVLLVESVMRDIFDNPADYPRSRPIAQPSEIVDGVYANTYSLPRSVPMTPRIQRELALLSNLNLLMPTLAADPAVLELYVGLESGLFYNYTAFSFENPDYDPRNRPWYIAAVDQPDDVIFTEVYEDAFGTGMVTTAAKAVFDEEGNLLGVAALDILLDDLKEIVSHARVTASGYAFIINSDGMYIVHPGMGADGFESSLPETGADSGLAEGYRRMMVGEAGFVDGVIDGERVFLTYSPISVADWSIGVIVYEEELLSALRTLPAQLNAYLAESEAKIADMSRRALLAFAIIFAVVVAMVTALSIHLTRLISKPIQKLTEEVVKMGEGEFQYRIPVDSYDEIGFLTQAFNDMADNLYRHAQDIILLNHAKSKLEVAANTDALTGIYNRRHFMDAAAKRAELVTKSGIDAFVVIFDLDSFKQINDTYGHPAGDKVLRDVAVTVKNMIRSTDLFARFGGEEFILFLQDIPKSTAEELTERIRKRVHETPVEFEGVKISVSASFGIAPVAPGDDLFTAIAQADQALYRAKGDGKNQTAFYYFGM